MALAANSCCRFRGRAAATYGLHPSMPELVPIYNAGHLAFVLNMGALNRPLTKQQYQQRGVAAAEPVLALGPDHPGADGLVRREYTGWGGRLLDLFGATDSLSAVSVSSPAIFLEGADVRSNVIPPGASLGLSGMNFWPPRPPTPAGRR